MADDKETVLIDLRVVESGTTIDDANKQVNVLSTSILGLQKANKALREERKLLDTSTQEGTKRIKEINEQIDKNDKAIKNNSSSLEKQRLNIGNYKGALDKLVPGLGATIEGIQGMTKAALQLIATPLGLILAAIALALASVAAYFKSSEEGGDKFAKAMAQVSAVINVLYDRVIRLGGAIVDFLSGDFEGGLNKMEGAFKGIGDEIEREVKVAGELAEALDALEERELKFGVAAGEVTNQIKELILQSKNRSKTEQERIALTQKATDLEIKQNNERKKIQEEQIRIAATQLQQRNSAIAIGKVQGETEIDFAKRLIENDRIVLDDRKKLAELLEKYNQAEGESIAILEKVQNQRDALQDKANARAEKDREARIKAQDDEDKLRLELYESYLEQQHNAYLEQQEKLKLTTADTTEYLKNAVAKRTEQEKKALADRQKAEKAAYDISVMQEKNKQHLLETGLGQAASLFRENTVAYKVLATAQAAINAGVAISRAFADYAYPYSLIVAALAAASGTAAIAKINNVQFAEGGEYAPNKYVSVGGRSHAQGGTRYVGEDGNVFEAERGEGIYILKKNAEQDRIGRLSALNMSHGGRSFGQTTWYAAQGGAIETRSVSRGAQSTADVQRIIRLTMETMPPPVVYVDDIAAKSNQVDQLSKRARVLG